jgi:GAF domain-containing protein
LPKKDSNADPSIEGLIHILTTLNEISASITYLGVGKDLPATLGLVANGAVRAISAGSRVSATESEASAVIWIFDAFRQKFDPNSRVSAGEPLRASIDDFPRSKGLGMQAIRYQRRYLSYEPGAADIHPAKQSIGATTLVCYPLIVGTETVGVLYVYRCDNRQFSKVELLILDNVVQLAAIAIHYGRKVGGLTQALSRKVREMEKLKRASDMISSRTNLDETLQEILSIGLELTGAQYGSLEFRDRRTNMLVPRAMAGGEDHPGNAASLPIDDSSVIGLAALHRRSVRIDDLHDAPWDVLYRPLPADREMRSELAVPIVGAGGGVEGVINIESPQSGAFSEEDLQLLQALATQAVIALQEIRLLDAMQEIVQVLLTAQYDELLKLIIDRACEVIGVSAGSIWIVEEPNTLILRQSTEADRIGERISLNTSFTGEAVRLRQPVTIDDISQHPRFIHPDLAREKGWVSAIVVPMLAADDQAHPVGSFSLYTAEPRDFSDWDKKMLLFLSNHAAVAIKDAELLRQLKEAQERQAAAESIAAMGDVAANLVHQLNNRVGAISVRVQGIEAKCADILAENPYLLRNLQEIADSTRQALAVVQESMAPLQPTPSQPVRLEYCLNRALVRANLPPSISVEQINLEKLPCVLAAEKQLELVFYNLIDNAGKAMAKKGKFLVQGRHEGAYVAVSITDNGPGIPPERQKSIFEFAPAVEQSAAGKLSFGLWWVKTFVKRFGGRIEVESNLGRGSTFTIWLPAAME